MFKVENNLRDKYILEIVMHFIHCLFQIPITSTKTNEKSPFSSKKNLALNVNKPYHPTLSIDQPAKSNEKSLSTPKKDMSSTVLKSIPSSMSVDISPILNKLDKYAAKKASKDLLQSSTTRSVEGFSKKIIEFGQKPVSISSSKTLNIDLNNPIDRNVISVSSLKTAKYPTSKMSHPPSVNITKISNDPKGIKQSPIFKKDSVSHVKPSHSVSSKESDDDVIYID